MSDQVPVGELEQRIHRYLRERLHAVSPTDLLDWKTIERALDAALKRAGIQDSA